MSAKGDAQIIGLTHALIDHIRKQINEEAEVERHADAPHPWATLPALPPPINLHAVVTRLRDTDPHVWERYVLAMVGRGVLIEYRPDCVTFTPLAGDLDMEQLPK